MPVDLADVPVELRPAAEVALRAAGVVEGHLSVELVAPGRIRELNREHRGRDEPTDVLSFPIDGADRVAGPRELGDVVICPEHAPDLDRGDGPRRPPPVRIRPRDGSRARCSSCRPR